MWIELAVAGLAGVGIGLGWYSWFYEPYRYQLNEQSVTVEGYDFPPLRVLQLSDFHFVAGDERRLRFLHDLAQTIEPVDLILITGDLIDVDSGIDICLQALAPFEARYGIYAVFGNHDYYFVPLQHRAYLFDRPSENVRQPNDIARLAAGLEELGIKVLQNQRVEIDLPGCPLTIAGIDDPYLGRDDVAQTFAGYQKAGPCLVLSHTPDCYEQLLDYQVDMVFSGHTHGGQVCLPGWGPLITCIRAPRVFAQGLHQMNGTLFHNSRGLGASPQTSFRLFCPPEANLFTVEFEKSNLT